MKRMLKWVVLSLFLAASVFVGVVAAGEVSTSPILRIETGIHTAAITGLAIDAAERFMVTASVDGTARVWNLKDRALVRTLRPPILPGTLDMELQAVDISPDGNTVAVGGMKNDASLYFYDRSSGSVIRHMGDVDVYKLAFSPDGKQLAAITATDLRWIRVADGSILKQQAEYGGNNGALDFDRNGRLALVTQGKDTISLFDSAGEKIAEKKVPAGFPSYVRFSPDGQLIAISYESEARVDVLSGIDLSPLYSPDLAFEGFGAARQVSWSRDGETLAAQLDDGVRFWPAKGKGKVRHSKRDFQVAQGLFELKNGAWVVAENEAWELLSSDGLPTYTQTSETVKFRKQLPEEWLSTQEHPDGVDATAQSIQFTYADDSSTPGTFSIRDRSLSINGLPLSGIHPPRLSAKGLKISGSCIEGGICGAPKVNGKALEQPVVDTIGHFVHTITPDGKGFFLAGMRLGAYTAKGKLLWGTTLTSEAQTVHVSGDGKLLVAMLSDGTIRWYRTDTGKELLAFFPHPDQERWVMWTPSGYFDASPGGAELIGWHINHGTDQAADFFPVSHFAEQYRRPDVTALILDTLDEAAALQRANLESGRNEKTTAISQQLPPVVNIVSPSPDSLVEGSEVRVIAAVRAPSGGPITDWILQIDGVNVPPEQVQKVELTSEEQEQAKRYPGSELWALVVRELPDADCTISFMASDSAGFGEAVSSQIRRAESAVTTRGKNDPSSPAVRGPKVRPNLYVVSVGVSIYKDSAINLGLADKDAEAFAVELKKQTGKLYKEVEVEVLVNEMATKAEVLKKLGWLKSKTTKTDVAMLFVAGHGKNSSKGAYYFLPHDYDEDALAASSISNTDILDFLKHGTGKRILFLDTCHAGNVIGTSEGAGDGVKTRGVGVVRSASLDGLIDELSATENGMVIFTASKGDQLSQERPEWGHGAFTKALLDGFQGQAAQGNSKEIWIANMESYVSGAVRDMTKKAQKPMTYRPDTLPSFPMAVVVGQ